VDLKLTIAYVDKQLELIDMLMQYKIERLPKIFDHMLNYISKRRLMIHFPNPLLKIRRTSLGHFIIWGIRNALLATIGNIYPSYFKILNPSSWIIFHLMTNTNVLIHLLNISSMVSRTTLIWTRSIIKSRKNRKIRKTQKLEIT